MNWWCETPAEFASSIYNFTSEVYFVGKLFEKLIQDYGIEHFQYKAVLGKMCDRNPVSRIQSFFEVQKEVQNNRFFEIEFSNDELSCYRAFADATDSVLTKIEFGARYVDDLERVKTQLDAAYRKCMLEERVPDSATILRSFLSGAYYYRKSGFPVATLKDFIRFLKSATLEKQRIAFANLQTRLDAITRYSDDTSDDIPF